MLVRCSALILLHKNIKSHPEPFLAAVALYRDDLVVAVECMFTWYWLADLCRRGGIEFVLGCAPSAEFGPIGDTLNWSVQYLLFISENRRCSLWRKGVNAWVAEVLEREAAKG